MKNKKKTNMILICSIVIFPLPNDNDKKTIKLKKIITAAHTLSPLSCRGGREVVAVFENVLDTSVTNGDLIFSGGG